MQASQRFERDPAVVCRRIGPETVLVPVRTASDSMSHIFALNDSSALVWDRLPATIDELVALFIAEYEVEEDAARADLEALLTQFYEAELIREVADGVMS